MLAFVCEDKQIMFSVSEGVHIQKYKRIKFRATKRFIKEIRYISIFLKNTFVNVRPVKGKLF